MTWVSFPPLVAAVSNAGGLGILDAEGVSIGTRFIVTRESPVPEEVKKLIIEKTEEDMVVTDNFTGVRCRVIRNRFADDLMEMSKNKAAPWEILQKSVGKIRKAYIDGDIEGGSLACGQACGLVDNVPTCRELIKNTVMQAVDIIQQLGAKIAR